MGTSGQVVSEHDCQHLVETPQCQEHMLLGTQGQGPTLAEAGAAGWCPEPIMPPTSWPRSHGSPLPPTCHNVVVHRAGGLAFTDLGRLN